jgi:hypothetical protein
VIKDRNSWEFLICVLPRSSAAKGFGFSDHGDHVAITRDYSDS